MSGGLDELVLDAPVGGGDRDAKKHLVRKFFAAGGIAIKEADVDDAVDAIEGLIDECGRDDAAADETES